MQTFFVIGTIAAIALLVTDSVRQYRATGKIPWWWFLSTSPWAVLARIFCENHPDMQYPQQERRIVKNIVRVAILGLLVSVLWIPGMILVLALLKIESDHSNLIIIPALIGFITSGLVLILRWMLFLSGQMPGDREK